ncbi:MAG: alpha-hydroxy acid oxidase [Candidatus Nanopelagicales bacterium]
MGDRSPIDDGIVAVHQLEEPAARQLSGPVWDYVSGGAADELSLADNVAAWRRIRLAPHTLVDVSGIDTGIRLLDRDWPHPIVLAPTARHTAYTPDGEAATIRGAHAAEALYVQSSLGGTPLAGVAAAAREAAQPWWFQVYIQRDRGFTRELVGQAVAAGAEALVLTVDTPTLGARDRDKRTNLGTSEGASYPILMAAAPAHPEPDLPPHRRVYNPLLAPDITWADLEWLVELSPVPVLTKGVLRPDDARRCVASGAAGVLVSNHGARNLDTVPATADALPGVVEAVGGDVPVLVDGGIRRGTDIAKGLALGATAVLVGRPYIWGLATYGAAGVTHVVEMLRTELEMAMALLGAPTIADLDADLLWPPAQQ